MRRAHWILCLLAAAALAAGRYDQRPSIEERVRLGFRMKNAPSAGPGMGEAVHLIYWEKWNNFEGEAMQACVNAFNRHSGQALQSRDPEIRRRFLSPTGKRIFVHLLSVTEVNKKTRLAVSGGDPPDLAGLWSRDVPVFAQYNAALPLDQWIQRDGPDPHEYYPCYWKMCVYRGHVWALLTTPATVALHWNKDLFKEAGLDPERPPRSLAELDAYNRKLTKRGKNGHLLRTGFLPTEPGWWNYAWGVWFGGRHVSPDGRTLLCDQAPWVRAYRWLNRMADFYGRAEVQAFKGGLGSFDSPENGFIAGKVAMVIQGVWMANFIRNYNPSMKWGAAPFPGPGGTPDAPVTIAQADVLIIPRGSPHPEEAWKFVRYVNSHGKPGDPHAPIEGMEILCLGQGKHTPFRRTTPTFLQRHSHEHLRVFMDLAASKNAVIEPLMPMWEEYRRACIASFEELWAKGNDPGHKPKDILKRLKERLQPKLDRAWAQIDRAGKN